MYAYMSVSNRRVFLFLRGKAGTIVGIQFEIARLALVKWPIVFLTIMVTYRTGQK